MKLVLEQAFSEEKTLLEFRIEYDESNRKKNQNQNQNHLSTVPDSE